jgi:hypothetical protein
VSARQRPAREARAATARRTGGAQSPTGRAGASSGRGRSAGSPRPGRSSGGRAAAQPVPYAVVVGATPIGARIAGGLLVLAGLLGIAALVPTYLVLTGEAVSLADGPVGVLAALLVPLTSLAVGALLAAGRLPKFGLAYAGVAGALALGSLLIEVHNGTESVQRAGREVLGGQWLLTTSVERGAGWWLEVAALGCAVLAAGCAGASWGRTVMEDDGALDPMRPGLAGLAVLVGAGTVLCLAQPAADLPDLLVTNPRTLEQLVVEQQGPQALYERPGWALLGGLLLAGALLLCSVLAPSLRPRLAAVGGLLAITAVVLSAGLTGVRAATTPELEWSLPGAGLLVMGVVYAGLTLAAWRLRRRPAPAA